MFTKLTQQLKENPKKIVFTEGHDARILEAASRLLKEGLLKVILVGNVDEVKAKAAEGGFDITGAEILDPAVINKAIDEALRQADEAGIHGKATTPFLLAKVKELTGGDSLESNIKLVFNNAALAAKTAAELAR